MTDAPDNTYIIDAESATELARLTYQDRLITEAMGGLFPERADLTGIHTVLDIACGPGDWTLDVAHTYYDHKVQVTGVDISQQTIQYARARARSQGIENVQFRVMDATKPLDVPDASFDLVNARFVAGFLSADAWPQFLAECLRILRPGGIIRLTEPEWNICNTPATERLNALCTRAMHLAGKTFTPDSRHIGITVVLDRFLRETGCIHVRQQAHALIFGYGTEAYEAFVQNVIIVSQLLKPFLIKMGVASEVELDRLLQESQIEMYSPDFQATMFMLTVWGQKQ
jgi:ubiquinone/menaquinone biosynthesis C-methylase UbiE